MYIEPPELIGEVNARSTWGQVVNRKVQEFALFDADGQVLRHSSVKLAQLRTVPPENPDLSQAAETITGPVLFAGMAPQQFGHILLNAIGRLWALDHLPANTRLYYITKKAARPRSYRYLRPVLRMFGITNDVVVSREPLSLPTAYTASEQFGECHDGHGSEMFYDWVDRRLPAVGPVDPSRKIYVTRTQLGPSAGRFALEDLVEQHLSENGYEIFAPEQHDLSTQVNVLRSAGHLIFAEGSALHLYGLVGRPEQKVVVVKRRSNLPMMIETQMNDRPGVKVAVVDAIRDMYWPSKPGDHFALSVLDFLELQRKLADLGMVSARTIWAQHTDADIQASLVAGLKPGETLDDAETRMLYKKQRRKKMAERLRSTKG